MATAEFGKFTGVHGQITIDGPALADVLFDIEWETETIIQEISGDYGGEEHIPGKRTIKTFKVTGALQKAEMLRMIGYGLNETPMLGTGGVLQAAAIFTAGTPISIGANPATPSRVRIALSVSEITTGGYVILTGTDINGNPVTEIIAIPNGSIAGTNFDGSQIFDTTPTALPIDIASGGGGELQFESLAGSAAYVFGPLKVFDLVGKAEDDEGNIFQVTAPDCWFKNGGLVWKGAGVLVPCDLNVDMHKASELEVELVVA
jgi:hypothetical protein